jgi:hypothetical protein
LDFGCGSAVRRSTWVRSVAPSWLMATRRRTIRPAPALSRGGIGIRAREPMSTGARCPLMRLWLRRSAENRRETRPSAGGCVPSWGAGVDEKADVRRRGNDKRHALNMLL